MKLGPQGAHSDARKRIRTSADGTASALAASTLPTTLQQRILAILLALVLAVSMVPSNALANDDATANEDAAVAQNETVENESADDSEQVAVEGEADSDAGVAAGASAEGETADVAQAAATEAQQASSGDVAVATQSANDATENAANSVEAPEAADAVVQDAKTINASCSIVGIDGNGAQQTWAASQLFAMEDGATAADLTMRLFKSTGLVADYDPNTAYGFYLKTITSPFDKSQTLGYDYATGAYWQLFVNGVYSQLGAGGVKLNEGDSIVWAYTADSSAAPSSQISVTCEIVGQDENGIQQTWAQPSTFAVDEGSNAADLTEKLFKQANITADYDPNTAYGFYLKTITSPFNKSQTLGYDYATGKYWQLFVNGKSSGAGADGVILHAGDTVSWVYSAYGDAMPGQISVSMEVIGKKDGKYQRWTNASQQVFVEGTDLATASDQYLTQCGFEPEFVKVDNDWSLVSLTSKSDGEKYEGSWVPFINGVRADAAGTEELKSGDKVVWAYDPDGDSVPNPDEVVVDPNAERPNWDADWDGGSNTVTDAATPAGTLAAEWTFNWKAYSGATYPNASEPIIVNGFVYLAVDNRLLKIDSATGKVLATGNLKENVGYTSRPVYADGVVIVPLNGGSVQALTADTLTTVWVTDAVSDLAQASCALTVSGSYVYVGTVDVSYDENWNSTFNNGFFTCINIYTGAVVWQHNNADEGYYWAGAGIVGGNVVVSTSAGTVEMLNTSTGSVVATKSLGSIVNSSCVVSSDGTKVFVVSRDGKLHVLDLDIQPGYYGTYVAGFGDSHEVDLGLTGSACIPTISGNTMYIGGEVNGGSALAIVDLETMKCTLVSSADGAALPAGGIKGAPLVSQQGDGTYVYFTVNYANTSDYVNYTSGGGAYSYKLGDAEASSVYSASGHNNYCDSPLACDKDGNLYYINDSGALFKLTSGVKATFNSNGGSSVLNDSAVKGGTLAKPADPTKDGYTFTGWYTDEACTQAYSFDTPVTAAFTLYAGWKQNPVAPGGDDNGSGNNGGANNGGSTNNNGNGANNGGGNGSNGNGGFKGAGASSAGSVAPSATPISAASNEAAGDGSDANAKSDESASSKDEKSSSDKATARSSSKSGSSESGVATTAANDDNGAAASSNGVPMWAYILLAVGVAGVAAAIIWFVVARRRNNQEK